MSETKFTPGPWKVYHKPLRRGMSKIIEVQDSEGAEIVPWPGFDACEFTKKTQLANAHLIAAAPDMYAALKEAFIVMAGKEGSNAPFDAERWSKAVDGCEKALAKAEGKGV